jgi:exopolysaccharide biosynthesis polyprenyl glycosylphosphotransferase
MLYESRPRSALCAQRRRLLPSQLAAPAWLSVLLASEYFLLLVADAIAISASTAVAGSWPRTLLVATLGIIALAAAGLYRPRLRLAALDDVVPVFLTIGGLWAVLDLAAPPVSAPALPAAPIWWWLVIVMCVVVARTIGYAALRRRRRRRGKATLVVGTGEVALQLAEVLLGRREFGLSPIGLVGPPPAGVPSSVPLLGPVESLIEIVRQHRTRHLVVAFPGLPDATLVPLLRELRQQGCTMYLVPRLFEMNVDCLGAEQVHDLPLVRMPPLGTHRWQWSLKRPLDVVGAALCLILLSPLFIACALAVRWEMRNESVLFRQERVGCNGRRFRIMKFRSLTPAAEHESQAKWSICDDPQVGPIGRLIRRTSMDELPQLINVLRGEMSLVGPRPERPFFVERFEVTYRHYKERHRVPPGITGLAQIHGLRGDTSISERAAFDNYYIENWSLGMDIKILLRTIISVFKFREGRR